MNAVVAFEPAPEAEIVYLPTAAIEAIPGFNPRRFFPQSELDKLATNIRKVGRVLQNLVVRPKPNEPGRYQVVAGERRWRAAQIVGLLRLPCMVCNLTDQEALAFAIAENANRADISSAEEALAAQRMMNLCEGDREEACKRLDWGREKLDGRLLLLHAVEAVLTALTERRIKLGHAELFSMLPAERQERALTTTIERKLTPDQVRNSLAEFALDLGTARFDLAGCQACPHNTTRQASLFEQNIGAGRCTNPPCFREKTEAYLHEMRVGLRDEYSAVFVDTEKVPAAWNLVTAAEVGEEQFGQGCKQCAQFGCLILSAPGKVGEIVKSVCFGPDCRQQKIAAHKAAQDAAKDDEEDDDHADGDKNAPQAPQGEQRSGGGAKPTGKPKKKKQSGAAANSTPRRVVEFINAVHRRAAAAEVKGNAQMVSVYAVLSLLNELGCINNSFEEDDPLAAHGVKRTRGSDARAGLIAPLYALSAEQLDDIAGTLASQIAGRDQLRGVTTADYLQGSQHTLKTLDTNLAPHFCIDAKFLAEHTKAGIEAVLREIGFLPHYNARHGNGAFERLFGERHADIIKKVMNDSFDFQGHVPKSVRLAK